MLTFVTIVKSSVVSEGPSVDTIGFDTSIGTTSAGQGYIKRNQESPAEHR